MRGSIKIRECEYCGTMFFFSTNKYCCEECRDFAKKLKKSVRSEITNQLFNNGDIRKTYAYGRWSKEIRSRACGKCEICGGTAVDSHHIVPIDKGGSVLDLDNGIALCLDCHRLMHPELPKEFFKRRYGR